MIEGLRNTLVPGGALAVLPFSDDTSSSLIRLLVFVAIFVGPAILKAIKESQRKRRESLQRGSESAAPLEERETSAEEISEADSASVSSGRAQWERLMRGESASAPPPIPKSPPMVQVPSRRVLTETRALTEEPALTETPALTEARPEIVATPGTSIEDPKGYDGVNVPKSRLGREFADFAPQEGLASDKGGGPAKRVGAASTFAGAEAFEHLSVRGAPSEVGKREIGGQAFDVSEGQPRSPARRRMSRAQLRRSMQLAEIIGPPVGVRAFDSGPTRPLGWS
jgi:hypothetical protein